MTCRQRYGVYSHLIHRNREWVNVGLLYALGLAVDVYHAGVGRPRVLKKFFCKQSFDASFDPLVRIFWLFVWQVVRVRAYGRFFSDSLALCVGGRRDYSELLHFF